LGLLVQEKDKKNSTKLTKGKKNRQQQAREKKNLTKKNPNKVLQQQQLKKTKPQPQKKKHFESSAFSPRVPSRQLLACPCPTTRQAHLIGKL